jgi:NAD(P)-dependent dehydrogenase (short-subunit alcohol dehydrogenase family)
VTGGASGIGHAAVRAFVDADAQIMIAGLDQAGANAVIESIGDSEAVQCTHTNIARLASVEAMVAASATTRSGAKVELAWTTEAGSPTPGPRACCGAHDCNRREAVVAATVPC